MKTTALLLLAFPGLVRPPVMAQTVGGAAARSPTIVAAAVPAVSPGWGAYAPARLLTSFPGLGSLGFEPNAPELGALSRVLSRTALTPEALSAAAPDARAELAREAVRAYARDLADAAEKFETTEAAGAEAAPARLSGMAARLADFQNVRLLYSLIPEQERAQVLSADARLTKRFAEQSAALVGDKVRQLASGVGVRWQGRTGLVALEDGSVLAFKTDSEADALEREAAHMTDARSWGIAAPVSLAVGGGGVMSMEQDFAKANQARGKYLMPYLLTKETAHDYLAYLNDPLPAGLSRQEKARVIGAASLRSIDDMALLLRAGAAHQSLAPISHAEAHWEWDYWRWVIPLLGKLRYGPSSIHGWKKALAYPNLRLSGLADYEHVQPLPAFVKEHRHFNHGQTLVSHDVYSAALGQNLAEWSLVVLHSARVNGLTNGQAARLVLDGLVRYAELVLPADAAASLPTFAMLRSLRSASRRFRMAGAIGWALQPLTMRVLKPYVELLRKDEVAGPGKSHPVRWWQDTNTVWMPFMAYFLPFYSGMVLGKTTIHSFPVGRTWPLIIAVLLAVQMLDYALHSTILLIERARQRLKRRAASDAV